MPVRMFGSGTGDGVAKVTAGLGDAFLGYLKQQAQEPLMQAQALKLQSDFDTGVAQRGKLGQETQILQNKAAWQAEGMNLPQMTPDQQVQWALRGHSIGEDPQRFVKGLASGEFFRAAQPGAQPMVEDRARNLGMALGNFANQNSAYTVPFQQEQQGKEFAQQRGLEGMRQAGADRRNDSALDKAIVPVMGQDGTPQYVTRRDAIGKTPAPAGGMGRPLPPQIGKAFIENEHSTSKIDRAIEEVNKAPNATGWAKGAAGSFDATADILNRADPEGIEARAWLADIGSLIIHDRSGAAVTVSEAPRLKPFIPSPFDTAETAKRKLVRLREAIALETESLSSAYGPETGYRGRPQQSARQVTASKPSGSGKIRIDANGNIVGGN